MEIELGKSLPGISGRDFLFAGYCSRLAQTVTDFADASHSESAKSTTTTVLYGIFSSENSYPRTVTFPGHIKRGFSIILLTFYRSHSIIYGIEYYITGKNK